MARLREWRVGQAVASLTSTQVDAVICNARVNAAHGLRCGDQVWRHAAPSAGEMLAILARVDQLELALLSTDQWG